MIAHSQIFQALHRERPLVGAWKVSLLAACVAASALIPVICIGTYYALKPGLAPGGGEDVDWLFTLCDLGNWLLGTAVFIAGLAALAYCAYRFVRLLIDTPAPPLTFQFRLADLIWFNVFVGIVLTVATLAPGDPDLRAGIAFWVIVGSVVVRPSHFMTKRKDP